MSVPEDMNYEEFKQFANGEQLEKNEVLSLEDKIVIAMGWALRLAYSDDGVRDIELSEDDVELVWGLVDFGYSEMKVIEGRCSLQASLDFNPEVFEAIVDGNIIYLKNLVIAHDLL